MAIETPVVRIAAATVTHERLTVNLSDGRVISTPLEWYPALRAASDVELQAFRISPFGLHWDVLDEDLGLSGMLAGNASATLPEFEGSALRK